MNFDAHKSAFLELPKTIKQNKQKTKLAARIVQLEEDLKLSLQKKSSSAAEINMPAKLAEIARLKKELAS